MLDEQLKYAIGLGLIEGVGPITARRMIDICGSPKAVFEDMETLKPYLQKNRKINPSHLDFKRVEDRVEKELDFIKKNKISVHYCESDSFPSKLKQCLDAPLVLYSIGKTDWENKKIVSIVGTRRNTAYGHKMTKEIVEGLKEHDVLILSGLALGIDSYAHKYAIECGLQTIGTMAHGLDQVYPTSHRSLAKKMCQNGGLITEFLSGTIPDRENFPKRNRIVAGMADCTVVVESKHYGGSLITADLANDYNRDVFAFPGRIGDEVSAGTNKLIKAQKAHLIESVKDLEFIMGWTKKEKKPKQQKLMLKLKPNEELIYKVLQDGTANIDDIALKTGLSMSVLSATLLGMEFGGITKSLPGKSYALV